RQPSRSGSCLFIRAQVSAAIAFRRSEEHTSELQSPCKFVCRLPLEKKRSHDGSDGGERAQFRQTGGAVWAAIGPDYFERESQRRAGFDRCVSRAGRTLQLSTAFGAH